MNLFCSLIGRVLLMNLPKYMYGLTQPPLNERKYHHIWRKYTYRMKLKKLIARARAHSGQWGLGCGRLRDWGALSPRCHTHTPARPGRPRRPPRGLRVRRPASRVRPPRSGPLAPRQPHAPPACATHHAVPRAFAHAHATHTRSPCHAHGPWRGEGRQAPATRQAAQTQTTAHTNERR